MAIDFRRLRATSVLSTAQWLGVKLKNQGHAWRGKCPICDHPSPRAFVVTPSVNRWWCHGACKDGGDALELVVRVKRISYTEAAQMLVDRFRPP